MSNSNASTSYKRKMSMRLTKPKEYYKLTLQFHNCFRKNSQYKYIFDKVSYLLTKGFLIRIVPDYFGSSRMFPNEGGLQTSRLSFWITNPIHYGLKENLDTLFVSIRNTCPYMGNRLYRMYVSKVNQNRQIINFEYNRSDW